MNNNQNYQSYYSVTHPGLWILLTDEEEESINQINRFIGECIEHSYDGAKAKNRCYIHVVGYNGIIHRLASGYINDLYDNPLEINDVVKNVSDGEGGYVQINCRVPIWCTCQGVNKEKKLLESLKSIKEFLKEWIKYNPDSPAPIVCNICSETIDSFEATLEVINAINDIKAIESKDGKVLFINVFSSEKNGLLLDPQYAMVQVSSLFPDSRILDNFRYCADVWNMKSDDFGDTTHMSFRLSFFERLVLPVMGLIFEPYFRR